MTPTMVNQQLFFLFFLFVCLLFFFTVKLDATNSFPSHTAEVRPIYLKMGHIMRKPVLSYVKNKGADQPAHPCSPISAFVVRCLIVTKFYSSKLYSSIGIYTVSPTCQFAESVFRYMYTCSRFHPAGTCYIDSVSLCRFFVINLFDKK